MNDGFDLSARLRQLEETMNYELHHLSADRFSAGEGEKLLQSISGSSETKSDAEMKFQILQSRITGSAASLSARLEDLRTAQFQPTVMHGNPGTFLSTLREGLNLFVIGADTEGLPDPPAFSGGIGFSVISAGNAVQQATVITKDAGRTAYLACPKGTTPVVLGGWVLPFCEEKNGWQVTRLSNGKLRQAKTFTATVTLSECPSGGWRGTIPIDGSFPDAFLSPPQLIVTPHTAGVPLLAYIGTDNTVSETACDGISLYAPDRLNGQTVTFDLTAEGEPDCENEEE